MWGFAFSVDFSLRPAPTDVFSGTEEAFVTPAELGLPTAAAVPAFSTDCLDPVVLDTFSDTLDTLSLLPTLLTVETFSDEPLTVPLFERTLCCFFLFSVTLDNLPSTFFSGVESGLGCFFSTSGPCSTVPQ